MKFVKTVLVSFIICITLSCKIGTDNPPASVTPDTGRFNIQQLQEDFQLFRDLLENNHPAIYLYESKENFDLMFDSAYASITREMTEVEFFRLLAPLVAKVNCGHTFIDFSDNYKQYRINNVKLLPLGVAFLNGKAYIYQNFSRNSGIMPGTEILSINNTPVASILETLLNGIPSDGLIETSKYWKINRYFFSLYSELIDNPDDFELRCIIPGETDEYTLSIEALPYNDVWRTYRTLAPDPPGSSLFLEVIESTGTAILTVKSFGTLVALDFKSYMQTSFQAIIGRNLKNLVIDLRGNGGGDPENGADLISYLIDYPFIYFSEGIPQAYSSLWSPKDPHETNFNGNVYFLIDGGCFSTTGHFCSLAQFHNLGIFIGEETGGSFYCNDGHVNRLLPNTGINLQYARTTWATAVSGYVKGRGIMPDYTVNSSLDDLINGFDRQMAYVLNLIASGTSKTTDTH
ncbi:MAG: S41 family peptidase [Candidatus Aminicenantes bacterium]|jgi:hypothetical protein